MPTVEDREAYLINRTIANEGGYVNHPADKGGPTNMGITAETLGAWRKLGRDATAQEIMALKRPEAEVIYRAWWVRHPTLNLHLIESLPIAWWAMDTSVLFGISRRAAGRWLQAAVGVTVDGYLGPKSIAAINTARVMPTLARCTRSRVLRHCQRCKELPSQLAFLEGWVSRAMEHLEEL